MTGLPRAARQIPPSTAAVPYPGRTPHWIKGNQTERVPHRWIVADTESRREQLDGLERQTFRLAVATRWRDDLATGDHQEWLHTESTAQFWEWVTGYCYRKGRTVLWFHNSSADLAWLDAFTWLPKLGWELVWCNLDRDVSVVTWRGPGGTLVIADTYTWCPAPLEELGGLVGLPKLELPADEDSTGSWFARCQRDVEITERVVRELLALVKGRGLGNWQPSGAGMGHTTWRHRFMTDKVLVHDDTQALDAEREAMHAGRAEAWWHGVAKGGPFTEWDMHMSYCRIAAENLLPAKLWEQEDAPSRKVHEWSLTKFRVLARVIVRTDVPVVPARVGGRIIWPVGEFETTLWDCELHLLRQAGGKYRVLKQWRYTRKPALSAWAQWSIDLCASGPPEVTDLQRVWVKHQSRAVIGRLALRTPTWEEYSDNWMPEYTGLSYLSEGDQPARRLMHVGSKVWRESDRAEAQQSVPQVTSWIMAEGRCRLWRGALAAGTSHVLHLDTDSVIVDRAGDAALEAAAAAGLDGHWRRKDTWRRLEITGPRHYRTPQRRQAPGVPRRAREIAPGRYAGEVWDSLARGLGEGRTGEILVRQREWSPQVIDHRRPYQGEENGPARPRRVAITDQEETHVPG